MKFSSFALSALAALAVSAAPVDIEKRGVVAVPVKAKSVGKQARSLIKRSNYVDEPIENQVYQYVATINVGSPAQEVEVLLDTGSSDLWVYSNKAVQQNAFNPSSSTSYKFKSSGFQIQYVSGAASGDWATDVVELEGATVQDQQIAVVDSVNTPGSNPIGIFGVGYTSGESVPNAQDQYANFPQSLANNKIIGRNAYSLFLDDVTAESGQILFGGIDTAKYSGDLAVVPIASSNSLSVNFVVGDYASGQAVLDSGTSLTYLPQNAVDSIASKFGATYDSKSQLYFVDSIGTETVTFQFNGVLITVPAKEAVIDATKFAIPNPPKPYVLAYLPNTQSQGINLLGDSFLRSAYVVYDLANKQIAIAQASYSSDSNIVALDGGSSIPGAINQAADTESPFERIWNMIFT